tara:strand:- start:204 stop:1352 length:1149 start_codon:yes stop_codon:yes gene_type:complete
MLNNPFSEVLEYFMNEKMLIEYGRDFDKLKNRYTENYCVVNKGISGTRDLLQKVIFEHIYFNLLTAAKLKYIYKGASDCYSNDNVFGLASFARAALEHTANYAYIVKKLESTVNKLTGQSNQDAIDKLLKELSSAYNISYYGTGNRNEQKNNKKPVHIHDSIKILDEYFGAIDTSLDIDNTTIPHHSFLFQESFTKNEAIKRFGIPIDPYPKSHIVKADYDFLCDFIHPNYGSNFLVSSGSLAEGLIDTPNENIKNLNVLFVKKCLRYWVYYKELLLTDAGLGLNINNWLSRSQKNGAKATRIFSKKMPRNLGDGKTKQTAFTFPTARDQYEEFEMFSALVKDLQGKTYSQSIAGLDETGIIDKIELDNGKVFYVKFSKNLF